MNSYKTVLSKKLSNSDCRVNSKWDAMEDRDCLQTLYEVLDVTDVDNNSNNIGTVQKHGGRCFFIPSSGSGRLYSPPFR